MFSLFYIQVRYRATHHSIPDTRYVERMKRFRFVQLADMFHKIMTKNTSKKKSRYCNPAVGKPALSLGEAVTSLTDSRAPISRRANVLNKLYTRHITDLLYTEELSSTLLDYDIQISKVKISTDFSNLTVYWIPKGEDSDLIVEKELANVAYPLRHKLTQLRVTGLVPKITFSKDKAYAIVAEVDRRLKMCEFGENYVPVIPEQDKLKVEFSLHTGLSQEIKDRILELEHIEDYQQEEEQPLPPMRTDVFGLDYNRIVKNVLIGIKRSPASSFPDGDIPALADKKVSEPVRGIIDRTMSRSEFKKFLKRRHIDAEKIYKAQCTQWKEDVRNTQLPEKEDLSDMYEEFIKEFTIEDFYIDFDEEDIKRICDEHEGDLKKVCEQ